MIFERDHDAAEISIGPCIRRGVKGKVKTTDIKDNMPYLTVLTLTYNLEPINTAMNFFGKCVYVSPIRNTTTSPVYKFNAAFTAPDDAICLA